MNNQGQQQQAAGAANQGQQQQAAGAANQGQQQQAAGAANQHQQQARTDIGQATNASSGSVASYETVASDDGLGNDTSKYKKL